MSNLPVESSATPGLSIESIITSVPTSLTGLAICVAFWVGVYLVCRGVSTLLGGDFYAKLPVKQRKQWDNFSWAAIHGVIAFVGACWSVSPYFPGPPPNMFDSSPTQRFFLQLTLGYILLDTFFLLKDWKDVGEWLMLIHHVVFPLTYGVSLYALDPPFGTYIMSVFQLAEVTTPFLHARWYLSTLGLKATKAYFYNGLALSLLFLTVRGGMLTYMVYVLWVESDIIPKSFYWEGSALCTLVLSGAWVFMALQYLWCYKVVTGMISVIGSLKKQAREKAAKQH